MIDCHPSFPYKNKTVQLIMEWQNTRSSKKSNEKVACLVHDVMLHHDFSVDDLLSFNATYENCIADEAKQLTFPQGFQQISMNIKVPSDTRDILSKMLSILGFTFHKLMSLIREEFKGPMFLKFHLSKKTWG